MDFHNYSLSLYESRQRLEDAQPQTQTQIVHYYEAINPKTGEMQWDGWLDNEDLNERRAILEDAFNQGLTLKIDTTPVPVHND
jgi:hypothetical protein